MWIRENNENSWHPLYMNSVSSAIRFQLWTLNSTLKNSYEVENIIFMERWGAPKIFDEVFSCVEASVDPPGNCLWRSRLSVFRLSHLITLDPFTRYNLSGKLEFQMFNARFFPWCRIYRWGILFAELPWPRTAGPLTAHSPALAVAESKVSVNTFLRRIYEYAVSEYFKNAKRELKFILVQRIWNPCNLSYYTSFMKFLKMHNMYGLYVFNKLFGVSSYIYVFAYMCVCPCFCPSL